VISLKQHIDGWVSRAGESDLVNPEPKPAGSTSELSATSNDATDGKPAGEWVEQTLQRFEANEDEMKKIVDAMVNALQSVSERDERYAREAVDIGQRLRSIASLKDVARVRQVIHASASSLTTCVERMVEDGRESLRRLNTQVDDYRAGLDKTGSDPAEPVPYGVVSSNSDDVNWQQAAEQWAERASLRMEANRRELKGIVDAIRRAVESVTERNERYSSDVSGIAQRLRTVADLQDLARIHHGVIDSASSLTVCVERITKDGQESLRQLTAEAEECRSRLDNPERLSSLNLLTELITPGRFRDQLSVRIKAGHRFFLILIALNGLKRVNSRFGRNTSDELVKQFALELRIQFPTADQVTRCGGEQFAVVITTSRKDALARVQRIRHAALGEYKVKSGGQFVVVGLDAVIGLVGWDGAENSEILLSRATTFWESCQNP
jgi:diguanylate cyclase (GGDEF)-like protein